MARDEIRLGGGEGVSYSRRKGPDWRSIKARRLQCATPVERRGRDGVIYRFAEGGLLHPHFDFGR